MRTPPLRLLTPPLLLLLLVACGPTEPALDCARFTFRDDPPPSSTSHVACTGACGNGLSPPTAGVHCTGTVPCRTHTTPQSACEWLHNLEHGHAVFLYDCPDGCPDVVAKLTAAAARAPRGSNGVRRALVAPATGLPARTAALLWRTAYLSDAPEDDALSCLLAEQDALAPEPGLACAP
jgi:hypothetical protein